MSCREDDRNVETSSSSWLYSKQILNLK
ncbi:hypothetical protein NC651_002634 [Populus alba x Populus x berolinensis]|nr:hypothetical protein NC651_002634 [Populus alba x Populus x berolinensis]